MPRGRPLVPLTLTDEQQDQLNGIARSATLPYALVQHARMVLASAEGLANSAVARRFGVTRPKVRVLQCVAGDTSATPFVWVATAQSIIDKVARIPMRISGTEH